MGGHPRSIRLGMRARAGWMLRPRAFSARVFKHHFDRFVERSLLHESSIREERLWVLCRAVGCACGAAVAVLLAFLKKAGLASALTALVPGVALCLFIHKCYWYMVDVLVGIDEKHGFDPRFIIFTALVVVAFIVGEVAVYTRKAK